MKESVFSILFLFLFSVSGFTQQWSTPEMLPAPVNSSSNDRFPFMTYDGKRLYFVSDRAGSEDIYYCDWDGKNWGKVVRLNSNINTKWHIEHSPSVTADGKTLYFVRYTNAHSYDIFYSTWQDTGWGPAVNIGPPINTDWMEWSCCISPDGKKLYFDSFHYWETMCPPDLCVSVKTDTGWSYPQLLFPDYDSNAGWEDAPSISKDDKTLYFDRLGESPWERDIWYTIFDGGKWTSPINIGSPINTPEAEQTPAISPDGNTLYFNHMVVHAGGDSKTDGIYVSHRITNVNEATHGNKIIRNYDLQNYPNPFNLYTVIRFKTPTNTQSVTLKIYNLSGKEVRKLVNKTYAAGNHEVTWNGKDESENEVASGLYFCRLTVNGRFTKSIKILLLK